MYSFFGVTTDPTHVTRISHLWKINISGSGMRHAHYDTYLMTFCTAIAANRHTPNALTYFDTLSTGHFKNKPFTSSMYFDLVHMLGQTCSPKGLICLLHPSRRLRTILER